MGCRGPSCHGSARKSSLTQSSSLRHIQAAITIPPLSLSNYFMGYLGTMPKALADIISAPGTPLRTHEQMLRSLCLLWIKEKGNLSRCVCVGAGIDAKKAASCPTQLCRLFTMQPLRSLHLPNEPLRFCPALHPTSLRVLPLKVRRPRMPKYPSIRYYIVPLDPPG